MVKNATARMTAVAVPTASAQFFRSANQVSSNADRGWPRSGRGGLLVGAGVSVTFRMPLASRPSSRSGVPPRPREAFSHGIAAPFNINQPKSRSTGFPIFFFLYINIL